MKTYNTRSTPKTLLYYNCKMHNKSIIAVAIATPISFFCNYKILLLILIDITFDLIFLNNVSYIIVHFC